MKQSKSIRVLVTHTFVLDTDFRSAQQIQMHLRCVQPLTQTKSLRSCPQVVHYVKNVYYIRKKTC